MSLSLLNCYDFQNAWPWNPVSNNAPSSPLAHSILYEHQAITATLKTRRRTQANVGLSAVFEDTKTETEWMIITGGVITEVESDGGANSIPQFHVQLMNLTHADLFGEQQWFQMTYNSSATEYGAPTTTCPPFISNATDDPWRKADLWQDSVPCAPTPRVGHLTAVVNDYLYVFHGYDPSDDLNTEDTEPDYHVYRIALVDVLTNSWSSWRRIHPRGLIYQGIALQIHNLQGGLWQETQGDLPKLVAMAQIVVFDDHSLSQRSTNQICLYNFEEDAWEHGFKNDYTHVIYDNLSMISSYSAIVMRDSLMIADEGSSQPYLWINLRTLEVMWINEYTGNAGAAMAVSSIVAYDTVVDNIEASVIVGTNPFTSSSYELKATTVVFDSTESVSVEFVTIRKNIYMESPPSYQGNSAVLSSTGNMYFYGGIGSDGAVWQINVGGQACKLDVDWLDSSTDDVTCYPDCYQPDSDSGEPKKLLLFLLVVPMLVWATFGRPNARSSQLGLHGGGDPQQSEYSRGLSPQQMETFPQRFFGENEGSDDDRPLEDNDNNICSICLVDFHTGDTLRDLPCKHFFHLSCVDGWLRSETSCPLCRESCQPAVDARDEEIQSALTTPTSSTTTTRWFLQLLATLRNHTTSHMTDTNGVAAPSDDHDDGVEMASVYSLELHIEDDSFDDEDNSSIISNMSSNTQHHVYTRSGEPSDQGMEHQRRHRHRRRGLARVRGEGSVPLTGATTTTMV